MSALDRRLARILERADGAGRRRTLEANDAAQGRVIRIGGRHFVNFSSNDYLGLGAGEALRDATCDAIARYGVGSGAASLLSGRHVLHEALEERIAAFMQREAALLYSSGYLANLGLVTALVERHDRVFHDRLNHASLIDAVMLSRARATRFPHRDTDALRGLLDEARDDRASFIVTDTVFSMDGDVAPLDTLAALATETGAVLVADDAHGFGVLARGRGAGVHFGLDATALPVQIVTFGKALGTAGAAVVGSRALIDALVQTSRTFIYDTAPPPALAGATLAALDVVERSPAVHDALAGNIAHFRNAARDLPLMASVTPIQPVLIGDDGAALAVADQLRDAGFYVRAVRPPTVPRGTARLRICVTASHTHDDIDGLVSAMQDVMPAAA